MFEEEKRQQCGQREGAKEKGQVRGRQGSHLQLMSLPHLGP